MFGQPPLPKKQQWLSVTMFSAAQNNNEIQWQWDTRSQYLQIFGKVELSSFARGLLALQSLFWCLNDRTALSLRGSAGQFWMALAWSWHWYLAKARTCLAQGQDTSIPKRNSKCGCSSCGSKQSWSKDLSQVIHSNPISMPGAQPEFWSQNQRIEEAIAAHGQHWTYDLYSSVEKSSLNIVHQRSQNDTEFEFEKGCKLIYFRNHQRPFPTAKRNIIDFQPVIS